VTDPELLDNFGRLDPEMLVEIAHLSMQHSLYVAALFEIAVRNGPRACVCPVGGKRVPSCPGNRDPVHESDGYPDSHDTSSHDYVTAARALGIL
jgi:hypothetical protein